MTDEFIISKMNELAKLIGYKPKDISFLKDAMCRQKIHKLNDGKNRDNYTNDSLATLGDSLLKFFLVEYLFNKGFDKGEITSTKLKIEDNKTLYELCNKSDVIKYAYNDSYFYEDAPLENQVSNPKEHNPYIEAIIGAIYKDKGIEYCKEWTIKFFQQKKILFL